MIRSLYLHRRHFVLLCFLRYQHPPHITLVGVVLVVTCSLSAIMHTQNRSWLRTKMEVVVLGVTDRENDGNGVRNWCAGRILAKVLGLISSEDALCLDLGSWASWKFLVEANNSLHANRILCSSNPLHAISGRSLFNSTIVFVLLDRSAVFECRTSASEQTLTVGDATYVESQFQ